MAQISGWIGEGRRELPAGQFAIWLLQSGQSRPAASVKDRRCCGAFVNWRLSEGPSGAFRLEAANSDTRWTALTRSFTWFTGAGLKTASYPVIYFGRTCGTNSI